MLTLSQGTEELPGCGFLARGGIPGCDFLPAEVFRTARSAMGAPFSGTCGIQCRQCSPLFWHLQNSVPERASYGTEYACRAKKGFLRYATHFLKPSVLKTGFWGTEGIFGTGNALLRYATHLQRRRTDFCCTGRIFKGAKQPTLIRAPPLIYPVRPYPRRLRI